MPELLVLRQRCCDRIHTAWPGFTDLRRRHLVQGDRFGRIPERATEEILRELFTSVLDWPNLRPADIATVRIVAGYQHRPVWPVGTLSSFMPLAMPVQVEPR
jgi:hypothetical protein